ncbi:hypothetical protein MaudCBS49596_002787 [Microsporum audouinii]
MESTFPPLPPHLEAQTLEVTLTKNCPHPSHNTSQSSEDMEAEAVSSPASKYSDPSDISTNDPPASLLEYSPPIIETTASYDSEDISETDSDSIEILIDEGDIFSKPFNMSFISVASTELVDDLDEGRLLSLLIEAYDLICPNELRTGIEDGTISLDLSLEDDCECDEEASYDTEEELEEEVMAENDRPGVHEGKRFVDGIFTWMKRVPGTDESELAVSPSEDPSEKESSCDLRRKSGNSDLHLAYETSEGPSV